MDTPATPSARSQSAPSGNQPDAAACSDTPLLAAWMLTLGRTLAVMLFLFDATLGSLALFWPDGYLGLLHPDRGDAPIDFVRRAGAVWLTFSAVALITATRRPLARARWFTVLGAFRLAEVPADLAYGVSALGCGVLGRVGILASVPLNLVIGGYLLWLAGRLSRTAVERARGELGSMSKSARAAGSLLLVCLVAVLAACPGPGSASRDPADGTGKATPGALAGALRIPPADADKTAAALTDLARRAGAGDVEAAWQRAHYLLDLFDDARFARDDTSLAVLHRGLALPGEPARGAEATQLVADRLDALFQGVLDRDAGRAVARIARVLLAYDRAPPARPAAVTAAFVDLKEIARTSRTFAASAELRLLGYCSRALADAVTAKYAERIDRVSHCLYPLYDASPLPYFASVAASRPPPPDWRVLASELDARLARVVAMDSRLARAATYQRRVLAELVRTRHAALASLPATEGLPALPRGERYAWTPLVALADLPAPGDPRREALAQAVAGDGRLTLTVAVPASAPASAVVDAARLAVDLGAARLDLAGVTLVAIDPPPGDYWHGRTHDGKAKTLAVLGLALAPLAAPGSTAAGVTAPAPARAADWDPARATLGLHLVVASARWQLVAATGVLAEIPSAPADQAARQLGERLAEVRAAFPDEDGLVLVPGDGVTTGDLVRAAQASERDPGGHPLIGHLAVAARAPAPEKPAGKTLSVAERIARRKGARVIIEPSPLAVHRSVVRACYQAVLEKNPRAGGAFRLELVKKGATVTVVVTRGPADRALRACVTSSLSATMKDRDMASAEITLDPQ